MPGVYTRLVIQICEAADKIVNLEDFYLIGGFFIIRICHILRKSNILYPARQANTEKYPQFEFLFKSKNKTKEL